MLKETFGAAKPIIAMVHFPPLPGSPQYDARRGMQWLVEFLRGGYRASPGGRRRCRHVRQ